MNYPTNICTIRVSYCHIRSYSIAIVGWMNIHLCTAILGWTQGPGWRVWFLWEKYVFFCFSLTCHIKLYITLMYFRAKIATRTKTLGNIGPTRNDHHPITITLAISSPVVTRHPSGNLLGATPNSSMRNLCPRVVWSIISWGSLRELHGWISPKLGSHHE